MKKFHLLFLILLCALICCICSCDQECRHTNISSIKTEADCTHSGATTFTCDDCGYTYKENIIEPNGHSFDRATTEPTCTKEGYTVYTCGCGFTYTADIVSATGHEYQDTITSPTCTSAGYITHTCKKCDYTYVSNHMNPVEHTYSRVDHAPTCKTQGYSVYTCSNCTDEYISDYTDPIPHSLNASITPATCESEGYTSYSCQNCEYTYTADIIAPVGHKLSSTSIDPTCTTEGKKTFSCENCSYSYVEAIKPFGHTFTSIVTMPTLSNMGYTEYTCSTAGCGYMYSGDFRFYSDILPNGAYANNSTPLAYGIDVSEYNYGTYEIIDFASIKASGIDYVIIKAGSTYRDGFTKGGKEAKFEQSYLDAKSAGLDVGVYFYTYARSVNEIIQDARLLLEILDGKQFEYPIYLDLEDESIADLDSATVTEMCVEFFTILQRAGYYTGLYVNDTWLKEHVNTEIALERFEVWYSHPNAGWDTERFGENLGMWQYSFEGSFETMEGIPFDLNISYKDYPTIIKNGGFNGYSTEDIKFVDSDKEFVYVSANAINIRSTPDFEPETNIIGFGYFGDCFEIVEKSAEFLKIKFNGLYAYITANTNYISYKFPIK